MLEYATRRQLQRLRFLLEEALARSQDQTDVGRHAAIVQLDGACEHAMALALGRHGRAIRREFRHRFDDLAAALPSWKPDSWASILQLHEARNLAQHHGIVTDRSYLPLWAAHAERFVNSLVSSAFEVQLRDVLVADAVENEEIRHLLVSAEQALGDDDGSASFSAATEGFDSARAAWRGQRAEAIGQLTLRASSLSFLGGDETDPVNRSLIRFEELLEVQPFAPDVAEFHWLVVRRGEVDQGFEATLEDARRAFQFVLAWVLRWEAFAAGYEERRYPVPPPPYEPPTTGADHPVVYDASVKTQHHLSGWLEQETLENVRYVVQITIADLPSEDRELWALEISDVLNEIIVARGIDRVANAIVRPNGTVLIHGVVPEVRAEELLAWIAEAIDRGGERYEQRLGQRRKRLAQVPVVLRKFEDALRSVDPGDLVAGVDPHERDDGSVWVGFRLEVDPSEPMLQHLLDESVSKARAGHPGIDYFDTTLWFQSGSDPQEAASFTAAIAADYRKSTAERAEGLIRVEGRRSALETELRAQCVQTPESGAPGALE
ncbi:MAG: hypothetical protein M3540_02965 [Actinomycetota bacterium]|nr:hypothetical protein [Actinomycetota bacterium]